MTKYEIVYNSDRYMKGSNKSLNLFVDKDVIKAAKERKFNISKMTELMLIDAIKEHDNQKKK